jgi:hypothetical protein
MVNYISFYKFCGESFGIYHTFAELSENVLFTLLYKNFT